MPFTVAWNTSFQETPANSAAISQGPDRITELKKAIRERMEIDHFFDDDSEFQGQHQKITFFEPETSYPAYVANKGQLYTKVVSDKVELHWTDEDGNYLQITSGGEILGIVPTGGIIMWSGAVDEIPTGYLLCDGTNGTPDLRDRFVVGAGSTYAVDGTGGEATHALIADEIPPHLHGFTHGIERPGNISGAICMTWNAGSSTKNTELSTGGGTAHNNLPPYLALAYIKKT